MPANFLLWKSDFFNAINKHFVDSWGYVNVSFLIKSAFTSFTWLKELWIIL